MKISSTCEYPCGTVKTHCFTEYSDLFSRERRHHFNSNLMQQIWIKKMALISTIIFENLRTSPTNRTVFQMHMPERFVTASSENCHANSSQYVADPSYFGQLGRRGHEFFNEHHQNFGSSHINHSDAAHDVAYYPQKYQPTQT